ncbi:YbaK/EbsC family protein [Anaerocolumna sedimenticola]|uniref:YbaK/EbsC family protein n=1 Tax=Anaerocolumna sedimenticola TaxID=2696063 RepID=A0A6P1TQH0_9FIRM|nr:YbaK/EbsC family protein [Anaerocolumna sedimenticola]QHQ63204.1 YbaK/EbsC family protein [Anaerocolumna sedimenticola]
MSIEAVKEYFKKWDMENRIQEFSESSATVEEAAKALGCEEKRIAKTMSFLADGKVILIVMAGDAKVDNAKYKTEFHTKAVMVKGDEVMELTGLPIGGVCPFGIRDGVIVYLDESLRRFKTVFPACGSRNSAIELTIPELETYSNSSGWVNIGKGYE